MTKKFKIVSMLLILSFVFSAGVFAAPKSTKVTEADIKAFCDNYDTIMSELSSFATDEPTEATDKEVDPMETDMFKFLSKKDRKAVTKLLNKYGVTGKNATDKVSVIMNSYMYSIIVLQANMSEEYSIALVAMGFDVVAYKEKLNNEDFELVMKNVELIDPHFNNAFANLAAQYDSFFTAE